MNSTNTCYRCNSPEDKQDNPGLTCEACRRFVHLTCLRSITTPGNLYGDIFFDFLCSVCYCGEEKLQRNKNSFPWFCVIYLTIQHLTINSYGISNKGFFHYKTHIASFIDRHWMVLFEDNFKQKKSWIGTLAGQLSMNNGTYFQSGLNDLGEPGWWKLRHLFSPAVAAHISQEFLRDRRSKGHHKNAINIDKQTFLDTVQQLGYSHLIVDVEQQPKNEFMVKFEPIELEIECNEGQQMCAVEVENGELFQYECVDDAIVEESMEFMPTNEATNSMNYETEMEPHSSPIHRQEDEHTIKTIDNVECGNLFTIEANSTVLPWVQNVHKNDKLVLLSEYEEVQLLKKIESLVDKIKDPNKQSYLRRLKTKLALRRSKRNKHLPVFDFDHTVRKLGGYIDEDMKMSSHGERVLDRFQRSYVMDHLSGTVASTNYGTVILSKTKPECFRSPYSGTMLKPYIRRDFQSRPTWMKLTEELLVRTNKNNPKYTLPPRSSINYMYVRPHHIAAVNNLCAQYLWPGIDLTESLQYPEFSCVCEWRGVVVGCAFLVPQVKHHEAYLSFVVTRPEWGRSKIASFMLYHLLQTCANQDVTLHVSPTNPAIFLYQKFGFKVEELIHDFYEKYYDINYKGCKHALFLRLVR